jgi:hypothetical protein
VMTTILVNSMIDLLTGMVPFVRQVSPTFTSVREADSRTMDAGDRGGAVAAANQSLSVITDTMRTHR